MLFRSHPWVARNEKRSIHRHKTEANAKRKPRCGASGNNRSQRLTKDDDSNVYGAEDAKLVGLLEETVLALELCTTMGAERDRARVNADAKRIDIFIATDL